MEFLSSVDQTYETNEDSDSGQNVTKLHIDGNLLGEEVVHRFSPLLNSKFFSMLATWKAYWIFIYLYAPSFATIWFAGYFRLNQQYSYVFVIITVPFILVLLVEFTRMDTFIVTEILETFDFWAVTYNVVFIYVCGMLTAEPNIHGIIYALSTNSVYSLLCFLASVADASVYHSWNYKGRHMLKVLYFISIIIVSGMNLFGGLFLPGLGFCETDPLLVCLQKPNICADLHSLKLTSYMWSGIFFLKFLYRATVYRNSFALLTAKYTFRTGEMTPILSIGGSTSIHSWGSPAPAITKIYDTTVAVVSPSDKRAEGLSLFVDDDIFEEETVVYFSPVLDFQILHRIVKQPGYRIFLYTYYFLYVLILFWGYFRITTRLEYNILFCVISFGFVPFVVSELSRFDKFLISQVAKTFDFWAIIYTTLSIVVTEFWILDSYDKNSLIYSISVQSIFCIWSFIAVCADGYIFESWTFKGRHLMKILLFLCVICFDALNLVGRLFDLSSIGFFEEQQIKFCHIKEPLICLNINTVKLSCYWWSLLFFAKFLIRSLVYPDHFALLTSRYSFQLADTHLDSKEFPNAALSDPVYVHPIE